MDELEHYAVCDEHLTQALRELLPETNTRRTFKVSRYDGESSLHNCFCGKQADWFFRSV